MKNFRFILLVFFVLLYFSMPAATFQAKDLITINMPFLKCYHTFHTLYSEAFQSLGDKSFEKYIQATNSIYKQITGVDISPTSPGADSEYLEGTRKAREIFALTQKSEQAAGQKLRGYILDGLAYDINGREAFADFKIAKSLAHKAMLMNDNFFKAEEKFGQEIHKLVSKSSDPPTFSTSPLSWIMHSKN